VSAIAVNTLRGDGSFSSVGEDGRLKFWTISAGGIEPETTLKAFFGTPLTSATHCGRSEVVAGSLSGTSFLWDVRTSGKDGMSLLLQDGDEVSFP
jgi:WD40 repeat protein